MSISGGIDLINENGIEKFGHLINAAAIMGTKLIFASAKASNEIPKEITYQLLRKAGDNAAKHDITICIETHPILCHNGDVALETMKGVNHENVRINFDTANIYLL